MLSYTDPQPNLTRRGFLSIGTLALGGLSLSSLLAAESSTNYARRKSIIFIFQQGGPSQFETFDPKPDAPSGVRTATGVTKTTIPGVTFSDSFSQLAKKAHKLTIVRSFQTENAGHNIVPMVSADTANASLGAIYSRLAGAIRPGTGMPTSAVIFPQAVSTDVTKGAARGDMTATGGLGRVYAPFVPGAGGQQQRNMTLGLPRARFEDRRELLAAFDKLDRTGERSSQAAAMDQMQDQAYQLLLGRKVADALDLSLESPKVVERYDTSRYARADNWAKARRGKRGYYTGHAKSLGKLLLLARRLCEAGCGFVTVHASYEGIWDLHADGENLNMLEGGEAVSRVFDHAVAAFIEDVEARGLSDDILLVCCGEMGRTPRLNRNGGRDHWAKLAPLMFYGGGGPGGRVIGQSTKDGGEPNGDALTPKNLISTLLHKTFDVGQMRLVPQLTSLVRMAEAEPIAEV